MNLADELRKLQDLRSSGTLTDGEFAAAKAALLQNSTTTRPGKQRAVHEWLRGDVMGLEPAEIQNQIARLDREWEKESEGYEFGNMGIPGPGVAVLGAVVSFVLTVFSGVMTVSMGGLWPLLAIILGLPGLTISIFLYYNARQYEAARRSYEERLAAIRRGEWSSGASDF